MSMFPEADPLADSTVLSGVLAGPLAGVRYQTASVQGITDADGAFSYRRGEAVTFFVGGWALGTTDGAPRANLAQLVNRVAGNIDKLADPIATNLARLVQTLDHDGSVEAGVTIAPSVHDVIPRMVLNLDQGDRDADSGVAGNFADDPTVVALLAKLNMTAGVFAGNTPRRLRSAAAARNELRRNIRGMIKLTDVKVPLRDGSYVLADVFRPAAPGAYPVVLNKGFYGKAFYHECICNAAEAEAKEELEDRFFSGNPDGLQYENHESVDASVWVPHGYACVRVDARGVCNSPGVQAPFSVQEAHDYYDAIEWAGTQPWSNGNVGLWGMSYLAMTQHNVASLQPPHLKAMIALGTDADIYNEALYGGGIFGSGFWNWWWKAWSGGNHCGPRRETDWMARARATPFNDPAAYGPNGTIFMRPDLAKATAPVWIVGPQTGVTIHQLGSSETFVGSTGAAARKFDFIDAWFPYSYKGSTIAGHMRWFDYWLKGIDTGIVDEAPVRVQLRTGNASYVVLEAQEWPIARTEYRRWYLDARPSDWSAAGGRDYLHIASEAPTVEASAGYDAEVALGTPTIVPTGAVDGTPRWLTGVSFISDPMPEDMAIVGYIKAGLWVSSTSADMDVFVSLRIIDADGHEVRYEAVVHPVDPVHIHPVGHGMLKVSHRALDTARSREYWPVQTHAEADYAPLTAGGVVAIEVGLNPSSALVRAGSRLRVDIQPYAPAGIPVRAYDASYHTGASNVIYTGPDRASYIQLPVVPHTLNP